MSLLQRKDVRGNGAGGGGAQRAVGERSAGAAGGAAPAAPPDPELVERPQRRRFSAAYKLAVLREADGLSRPGEIGALLRREGLYSSPPLHLARAARGGRPGGPLAAPGTQARGFLRGGARGAAAAPYAHRDGA